MSKVAGNDVDATQEYMYSEIYGLIRRIPYFVGHDKTSNIYKLTQGIDRQKYRLNDIMEIVESYKKIYGDLWEQSIGDKLTEIGNDLGMVRFLYEPYTSYINRLFNLSNFSIVGATEDEIRDSIYYFINDEDFNRYTQILIGNPYEGAVYKFFSGTGTVDFVSKTAPEGDKEKFVSDTQLGDELYQLRITLPSGASTDRRTYEYWNIETNLTLLYNLLKSLSPIGVLFTIKLETI